MNCDFIARWYRFLEYASFGRALHRRRCHFLPQLAGARKVLVLGEGDGRFLAEFVCANPKTEVDYFDCSEKMLLLTAKRIGKTQRVHCHCGDILNSPLPGHAYDLIVTHFFLDCFAGPELTLAIRKISEAASDDARWVVSEFREPPNGWRRLRARFWIRFLYFAFRVATGLKTQRLPNYAGALQDAGFELQSEVVANAGLLTSQMWIRK
jgi:ubiquinone/menaquinone biosynthesis C-methylase UbiE